MTRKLIDWQKPISAVRHNGQRADVVWLARGPNGAIVKFETSGNLYEVDDYGVIKNNNVLYHVENARVVKTYTRKVLWYRNIADEVVASILYGYSYEDWIRTLKKENRFISIVEITQEVEE